MPAIPFLRAAALCAYCATLSFPAAAVTLQMGHRPVIGAVEAPKTAKAGQAVKITVTAKQEGGSACGLVVDFGDGSDRQFKINRDDLKFPVSVEHTYKKDGRYTVKANGREITTHKGCKGSASAVVQVGAPKKPAAKSAKPKT